MSIGRRGVLENVARFGEQERFVIGVVHEPTQFIRERVDQGEVLLHAFDESVGRHARVAGKRRVTDEVRTLEALAQRRPPAAPDSGYRQAQTAMPAAKTRVALVIRPPFSGDPGGLGMTAESI
jgi:hypothetical protein